MHSVAGVARAICRVQGQFEAMVKELGLNDRRATNLENIRAPMDVCRPAGSAPHWRHLMLTEQVSKNVDLYDLVQFLSQTVKEHSRRR